MIKKLKFYFKSLDIADWINLAIMSLLALFCFVSIIYFFTVPRLRDSLNSFAYLLTVPLFFVAKRYLRIKIPPLFTGITAVFIAFCLLGSSYNLYTVIPPLDDILHGVWGVVFCIIGFTVFKCFIGEPQSIKSFIACIFFAVSFTAFTAVIWEIYEFTADCLFTSLDMQEDSIVNTVHSFLLYPDYDHYHTEVIEGIARTVLYDADGNVLYVIDGGYLDIGVYDTMWDIIWCTVATLGTCVVISIERFIGKNHIYNNFIPRLSSGGNATACVERNSSQTEK